MEISNEIRSRIIEAANQLYQESDSDRFPTVDQVRRAAKADMNTTSMVMKEWRRQQTAAPAAVAVAIPERVQEAMSAALATLWSEAQELANESLAAAKQAWEAERADTDAMRVELAQAFEQQADELDDTRQKLAEAQDAAQVAGEKQQQLAQELAGVTSRLHEIEAREQAGQQRIEEPRAELAEEKTEAQQQGQQYRQELEAIRAKMEQQAEQHRAELAALQEQRDTTAQELATVQTRSNAQQEAAADRQKDLQAQADKLAAGLEKAQQSAAAAREQVAGLAGKLEVMENQNKELVAALKAQPKAAAPRKRTPAAKKDAAE